LFETKHDTKAWEVAMKRQEMQAIPTPTATVSLADWGNTYLDYAVRFSPKTYSEKRTLFQRCIQTWGAETAVASLSPGMALAYLQHIFHTRPGHAANKQRKNMLAAWHFGQRYIDGFPSTANPLAAIPRFPQETHPHYVPPERDFWKVADVAK